MSPLTLLLVLAAVAVGCLPPVQAGVNSTLARYWEHPLLAALTNTLVASMVLAVAVTALRVPLPVGRAISVAPWWAWGGGVLGAVLVLSAILLAPRLGATGYVSAMVVGTVTASLLIDHFGLIGFHEHPVSALRLVGGALVITGMLLVQTH